MIKNYQKSAKIENISGGEGSIIQEKGIIVSKQINSVASAIEKEMPECMNLDSVIIY